MDGVILYIRLISIHAKIPLPKYNMFVSYCFCLVSNPVTSAYCQTDCYSPHVFLDAPFTIMYMGPHSMITHSLITHRIYKT